MLISYIHNKDIIFLRPCIFITKRHKGEKIILKKDSTVRITKYANATYLYNA